MFPNKLSTSSSKFSVWPLIRNSLGHSIKTPFQSWHASFALPQTWSSCLKELFASSAGYVQILTAWKHRPNPKAPPALAPWHCLAGYDDSISPTSSCTVQWAIVVWLDALSLGVSIPTMFHSMMSAFSGYKSENGLVSPCSTQTCWYRDFV